MDLSKKVFVLGIDGAPQTLLSEYAEQGVMPNLKNILSGGYSLIQMDASIPDVSSTSWASFMTGVNPGEHGIYGFMELLPNTYRLAFPNYASIKAPALWDIIGGTSGARASTLADKFKGRVPNTLRSIVINMPETFPAPALNGVLTSGFVCPDLRKGTYPESAYEYLRSINYIMDIEASNASDKPDAFFDEALIALQKRAEAFMHFMDNERWDLFIGVVTETDRLHHFFFDAARDKTHKYHERFVFFYTKMDDIIGRVFERFMASTNGRGLFMTMSDHGFAPIRKEVYLNRLFVEKGLLTLDPVREYFEQVGAGSKAFVMDPGRIYLNYEGRYPGGAVPARDRGAVLSEIKSILIDLKDSDGNAVIKRVYDGTELYSGNESGRSPDLVAVGNDGFDIKGNIKKPQAFGTSHFRGMHTRHDAHCVMPSGTAPLGRLHIENLASIILERFI
ncbi:MAG: alkaline phosphatase family protein [Deltaproteobacteria bacterium]|nr:alkaline phosphatase family protein [Deltaproteobacteria bacterium]